MTVQPKSPPAYKKASPERIDAPKLAPAGDALPSRRKTPLRYNNFDYLRLFLALDVLFIHWQASNWGTPLRWSPLVDPVPCFVALSGLLIPDSFRASKNWQHFAWKRMIRVYPAFLCCLVLVLALFGSHALWPTLLVYLTVGLIEPKGQVNGVLWSLMLEEILYGWHVISRLTKLWGTPIAVLCLIASMCVWYPEQHNLAWSNITRTSAAFFAANIAYRNLAALDKVSPLWFVGAFALTRIPVHAFIGFTPLDGFIARSISMALIPIGPVGLVLAVRAIPQIRFQIPDVSYGVYLYHGVILLAALHYCRTNPALQMEITLPATLALSAASCYLVERPALKLKNRVPSIRFE